MNQDPFVRQGYRVANKNGSWKIWGKELADGGKALAFFNLDSDDQTVTVPPDQHGLDGTVRDLWRQRDLGKTESAFSAVVSSHGTALFKVGP